jgi:hypothetical protein
MNPVRIEWIMGLLGLAGRTSRPVRAGVVRFRLAMTHSQIPLDREIGGREFQVPPLSCRSARAESLRTAVTRLGVIG